MKYIKNVKKSNVKPKYKNMILGKIGLNTSLHLLNTTPIIDGENYVYSLKHDNDSGFNSFYDKKTKNFADSHKICEKCFYTRYAVKQVIWKNETDNKSCYAYAPVDFTMTGNSVVSSIESFPSKNTFHIWHFDFSGDKCELVNSNCHQSHLTINNVFTIYSSCYDWKFNENFESLFYENINNNALYISKIYSQADTHSQLGNIYWHDERAAESKYVKFISEIQEDYVIYDYKESFPWYFDKDLSSKSPDIKIDLWRNKEIIENGAAIHLPSDATNTIPYDKKDFIKITVNNDTTSINVNLNVRNCYRNLYSYDKNGIKVTSGDVIADDNFKSLIQDSYDCGCK